jgi:hypothetical protein
MRHHPRLAVVALLALTSFGATLHGQILRGGRQDTVETQGDGSEGTRGRASSAFERRSSGSFSLLQIRPLGGLANNIGFGYGGSANYVFRLDRAGVVGLRIGGSFSGYGRETMTVPLSYSIGGRILANVHTDNTIGTLTFGPQLMFPDGPIRPYVNAGIGVVWFATTSSVDGVDDNNGSDFATRNYSDGTPTWAVGTGVHIPLVRRTTAVLLDLGVEYFYGGEASYLRKGSIVDLPNAQIEIHPLRSETRFLSVNAGVRITP